METFSKSPLTSEAHIELLKKRGLHVGDEEELLHFLNTIGYFRLTGYMFPFQSRDGNHAFEDGTTWNKIKEHYVFDKKLRFLLLEAIEVIEIGIRCNFSDKMALSNGPHWYLNQEHFNNQDLYDQFLLEISEFIKKSGERFIKKYLHKYDDPSLPPTWMVMETISFGQLASLYENLKDNPEKKAVANDHGLVVPLFTSWIKSINYVRNLCAHHNRLWNRSLTIKPKIPRRPRFRILNNVTTDSDKKLFGVLSCILHLLKFMNPISEFKPKLLKLLKGSNGINLASMGFPDNWQEEKIWSE